MIEVVAIDNRTAETELLRLAAHFAHSRLFPKKLAKRLAVVVEVAGDAPARPIMRAQLAQKAGLFRSAKFHYDFCISVAQGFEAGLLQMMHELVHISQIATGRYALAGKAKKHNGEKVIIWRAHWCGKKAGVIDDMAWHERPWEQEAVAISEQLSQEFLGFIYGAQNQFDAQGGKKELRLYPVSLSLPEMPPQVQPISHQPEAHQPVLQEQPLAAAEPYEAPPIMPAQPLESTLGEAPALDVPGFDAPGFDAPGFDAPGFAPSSDQGTISHDSSDSSDSAVVADDALLADIDALLSKDAQISEDAQISGASSVDAPAFDAPSFDAPPFDAPPFDTEQSAQDEKRESLPGLLQGAPDSQSEATQETFVTGFAVPRILKLSVLEAKQKELAARGLLEK